VYVGGCVTSRYLIPFCRGRGGDPSMRGGYRGGMRGGGIPSFYPPGRGYVPRGGYRGYPRGGASFPFAPPRGGAMMGMHNFAHTYPGKQNAHFDT